MFRKATMIPLAALVLVAAAPAPSAALASNGERQNVTSDQSGGSDPSAKAERKICKNLAGSARRLDTKRLCMTRAEWREFEQAMQD
jgi:hypothetical protein